MYDLIGDIHGHATELISLLQLLGYEKRHGVYSHPERKVIFLGDFIDRGPQIRDVLQIVRPMVEAGHALAVMGNHELNALAFHTLDSEFPGEYLRRRTAKNCQQHHQTLLQLKANELDSYLDWFRTLPMWLELQGLRAVHACWDDGAITTIQRALRESNGITNAILHSAAKEDRELFSAAEIILKGREAPLPEGVSFRDKDGHVRMATRVRWYLPPMAHTYRTYALTDEIACDLPLDVEITSKAVPYPSIAKPVFVGHYWMSATRPTIWASNVACLDYSVAKGGFLCAYRWHGEQTLCDDNFVWTSAVT